jgi:hypothetical protein
LCNDASAYQEYSNGSGNNSKISVRVTNLAFDFFQFQVYTFAYPSTADHTSNLQKGRFWPTVSATGLSPQSRFLIWSGLDIYLVSYPSLLVDSISLRVNQLSTVMFHKFLTHGPTFQRLYNILPAKPHVMELRVSTLPRINSSWPL